MRAQAIVIVSNLLCTHAVAIRSRSSIYLLCLVTLCPSAYHLPFRYVLARDIIRVSVLYGRAQAIINYVRGHADLL